MTSAVAGSDNQLSGFHNLSTVCISTVFCLLFCFPGWGWNYLEQQKGIEQHAASQSKRESQEAPWPGGFGLYTRHRLLKGWRASPLRWERASAMFTVMFQGMLRGFKHIKHIYKNTDIGNAMGSHTKGTDTLPKTHMPTALPWKYIWMLLNVV